MSKWRLQHTDYNSKIELKYQKGAVTGGGFSVFYISPDIHRAWLFFSDPPVSVMRFGAFCIGGIIFALFSVEIPFLQEKS